MKIGFIGTGSMAQAIIKGIIKNKFASNTDIYCTGRNLDKLKKITSELKVNYVENNNKLSELVDIIVLSVKPQSFDTILAEIKESIEPKKHLIISIAAGISLQDIEDSLGKEVAIIRTMPNINATINESVTSLVANKNVDEENLKTAIKMFEAIGSVYEIEEKDFTAFMAIAGCSTAFTYMYIDALARAAQKNGLPKDLANVIAAQAVKGSAMMSLESEKTPNDLVEDVCSPGGTTIEGVCSLKDHAFEGVVIKATQASIDRDRELLNKK